MHVRPCLYCIILLLALFTSSCYWEPWPTALLLQRNPHLPKLNASDLTPYERDFTIAPLIDLVAQYDSSNATLERPMTRLTDRCWCDLATYIPLPDYLNQAHHASSSTSSPKAKTRLQPQLSSPFDPFDQRGWESASLIRHARQLSRTEEGTATSQEEETTPEPDGENVKQQAHQSQVKQVAGPWHRQSIFLRLARAVYERLSSDRSTLTDPGEAVTLPDSVRPVRKAMKGPWHLRLLNLIHVNRWLHSKEEIGEEATPVTQSPPVISAAAEETVSLATPTPTMENVSPPALRSQSALNHPIPFWGLWVRIWCLSLDFLSKTHDLEPYGFPVIVDFAWGRS